MSKDSTETKKQPKEKGTAADTFREYSVNLLVCLIIALFVVTFVVHPMAVPTPSMDTPVDRVMEGTNETMGQYNLLVGDRLVVDKFTILANHFPLTKALGLGHTIRRGEVVVFKSPDKDDGHYLIPYVKRVIGLPGETIEVRQNRVFINGKHLIEPYAYHSMGVDSPTTYANMPPLRIPEHHYFMMGDNRDESSDSRAWGTVRDEFIFGKPVFILWSFPDDFVLSKAFPDNEFRGVHEVTSPADTLKLYLYRIVYFYKTRWSRMFHFVPRGHSYFEGQSAPAS